MPGITIKLWTRLSLKQAFVDSSVLRILPSNRRRSHLAHSPYIYPLHPAFTKSLKIRTMSSYVVLDVSRKYSNVKVSFSSNVIYTIGEVKICARKWNIKNNHCIDAWQWFYMYTGMLKFIGKQICMHVCVCVLVCSMTIDNSWYYYISLRKRECNHQACTSGDRYVSARQVSGP